MSPNRGVMMLENSTLDIVRCDIQPFGTHVQTYILIAIGSVNSMIFIMVMTIIKAA